MLSAQAPQSSSDFIDLVRKSGLVAPSALTQMFPSSDELPGTPFNVAAALIEAELLTQFQARQLLSGKHRGFVLGPYKLLRPLGQGGMGTVYLAEHMSLGRKVAIKVLTADKAKDKLAVERFMREARAAAALDHPGIVKLFDVSQGAGVHFLVMEYVEGKDLQSFLAESGPLHYAQATQYIAQAAIGLQHAHGKGFIHRDIKPANMILTKDGAIKILDMGLARSLNSSQDDLTAANGTDNIVGTVDFISPEQAQGGLIDERSDIYNLGATLFALLVGHPPFSGTTTQKLMQLQLKDPQELGKKLKARVPPALVDVVLQMMAKKPSERYQNAEEVVDALGPWLPAMSTGNLVHDPSTRSDLSRSGSSSRSRAAVGAGSAPGGTSRKRIAVVAGAFGAVGLVLAVVFALAKKDKPADPVPQRPPTPVHGSDGTARPGPTPANSGEAPNGDMTYHVDFGHLATAQRAIDRSVRPVLESSIGPVSLPVGVQLNHWAAGAAAEYRVADFAGSRALGVWLTGDAPGAQYNFSCNGLLSKMTPGKKVVVRLTYAFVDGEAAWMFVEQMPELKVCAIATLAPTGNKWATADLAFIRPEGNGDFHVVVRPPHKLEGGGTLWVKAVDLLSPGAASSSP